MTEINSRSPSLLIIDDDFDILDIVSEFAKNISLNSNCFSSGEEAIPWLAQNKVDIALIDYHMPSGKGPELAQKIKESSPSAPLILTTGYAKLDVALEAMRAGMCDILFKPFSNLEFENMMNKHLPSSPTDSRMTRLVKEKGQNASSPFLGISHQVTTIIEKLKIISKSEAPLLLTGETGVGKEVAARFVHQYSRKKDGPFIAINCSAYPETLLESELFGHVKGAFTGADKKRVGILEEAANGTLLLDEVGDIPPRIQLKLLRVLQEKTFERVGDNKPIPLSARIISATNADLGGKMEQEKFRGDFFHRLNTFQITLPPLRERKEDVKLLFTYYLGRFASEGGFSTPKVDDQVWKILNNYSWPGNIRELKNCVEHALVFSQMTEIKTKSLPESITNYLEGDSGGKSESAEENKPENNASSEVSEKTRIERALGKRKGNKSKAAKDLDMTLSQLIYRLKKYEITISKGS